MFMEGSLEDKPRTSGTAADAVQQARALEFSRAG